MKRFHTDEYIWKDSIPIVLIAAFILMFIGQLIGIILTDIIFYAPLKNDTDGF